MGGWTTGRRPLFVPGRIPLDWLAPICTCRHFPGHALHEEVLQRQISVCTLVSSQERRAAVVLRINRLSTRRSTAGFVPPSVYMGLALFVLLTSRSRQCLGCPGKQWGRLSSGRTDPSASRRTRSRPAPPLPRGLPRPDVLVVRPGFGFDKFHGRHVWKAPCTRKIKSASYSTAFLGTL